MTMIQFGQVDLESLTNLTKEELIVLFPLVHSRLNAILKHPEIKGEKEIIQMIFNNSNCLRELYVTLVQYRNLVKRGSVESWMLHTVLGKDNVELKFEPGQFGEFNYSDDPEFVKDVFSQIALKVSNQGHLSFFDFLRGIQKCELPIISNWSVFAMIVLKAPEELTI